MVFSRCSPYPQLPVRRTNLYDGAPIQCSGGYQVALLPTMGGDPYNTKPYTHL